MFHIEEEGRKEAKEEFFVTLHYVRTSRAIACCGGPSFLDDSKPDNERFGIFFLRDSPIREGQF
jgi:hypothetical protein